MTKIWQKSKSKSNPVIEKYNTGDDYLIDVEIFPFDIRASSAHAEELVFTHKKSRIILIRSYTRKKLCH